MAMAEIQTLTRSHLRGEISRIVFRSDDGQFAVLKLKEADGAEHVVRGALAHFNVGQHLELSGVWEQHAEFGMQFKVEEFKVTLPSTPEGIKRFLASGAIPGIGEKTAALIVDFFGNQTLDVLRNSSARLREVPHIGKKKADMIIKGWRESEARRDAYIFLQGLGITPAYCARLFKTYGEEAPAVVRDNPYRLAEEVDGIGFLKADQIAGALGIGRDSIARLTAAAVFSLNQLLQNGHTCCPEEELLKSCTELTGEDLEKCRGGLKSALARHLLVADSGMIYTPQLLRAESKLPALIVRLANVTDFAGRNMRMAMLPGTVLNDEQQNAVRNVARYPLSIITGGPGVGKTTVVGAIVRSAKAARLNIALAAPTGRAAKRLSESTHLTSKTIHRLLMFDPTTGKFNYDENNPLDCDLLIVDEISMLDLLLAFALFKALRPGTNVVLVGDADQLPSVGPGTVLRDFLQSQLFAVTKLEQIFRQGAGSKIIVNAHRVNSGRLPEREAAGPELSDFYWIEQNEPEKVLEMIVKLVTERIPQRFGLDSVDDVQVLCPMNRGICGTVSVNETLHKILNPGDRPQFKYGDRTFLTGDKVMQTANNYDKNVFNGDMGRIGRINFKDKKFMLHLDDRQVEYGFDECDQLTHAYAITIHKSQGSEFPAVIIPLLNQHFMMLERNLLYTGMTRAKKLLIVIGGVQPVRMAVENIHQAPRFSLLGERLKKAMESPEKN